MKNYSEIRGYLNTGDIVLFSGKGLLSTGIKWGTFSKWSHVGMVLNLQEYDFLTLWESTTLSNIKDLVSGNETRGVQLVPLSQRVSKYNGDIAVRRLENFNFDENHMKTLMELREKFKGKPYEESQIELIKAAYDSIGGQNEEDLSSLFCSELVAEAYQHLGLLIDDKPSNEYTPADFSEKKSLDLQNGAALGPEITIKKN